MKKLTYLFTFCSILFGLTTNAQIVAAADDATAIAVTAHTEFSETILIGANTRTATGVADDASQNTGLGYLALDALKKGDFNTAVGYKAGTALAGVGGTGGNGGISNTLIGKGSGLLLSNGDYNVALGAGSGSVMVGGDKNVFIGHNSKGTIVNNQNRIGLGQAAVVANDNSAVIGNTNVTQVYFGANAANDAFSATLNAKGLVLENGESITNATDNTIAVTALTTTFSGNVTVSSDMRLKDNILPLGSTMTNILKLDGKSYTKDGREEIGLLAQDVQLVYPELVSEDPNGMLSVNYQALSAILINGVKDQEARIQKLEILVKLLLENK